MTLDHRNQVGGAALAGLVLACSLVACSTAPRQIELSALPERPGQDAGPAPFTCKNESSRACLGSTHYACKRVDEFIDVVSTDCSTRGLMCDAEAGCIVCQPGQLRCKPCTGATPDCNPDTIQRCTSQRAFEDVETCDLTKADTCDNGRCINACELATQNRSYVGCEFYAADLDNAAIDDTNNAAGQQYAVVVANPQRIPVSVSIDLDEHGWNAAPKPKLVMKKLVPPGDIEVFPLPKRELDGSSATGLNDGTNTAVSANAYHVTASLPITAYQFNPLENVNVFSNDASLLLPVPALGRDYTVVSWPQTIGNSDDPAKDFDSTSSNEDLRAFLTIIGTKAGTKLRVELGPSVQYVVGAGPIPRSGPGDVLELQLGPFDVVNLETQGLNADFTGSRIHASEPVTVFVGNEASDVPMFGTYAMRQCCADHLEAQLLPDVSAGTLFVVARMPPRTKALAAAALPDMPLGVAVVDEPEWARLQAIADTETHVKTSLPAPNDEITLAPGANVTLRADQDFVIQSDRAIAVLQALPSQGVTGIPRQYPGGDPSILTVPPVEQFRRDYIFLTPDKYAFDFVTIVANEGTKIELDGAPLPVDACPSAPIPGLTTTKQGKGMKWLAYRCQLSFPDVTPGLRSKVLPGRQNDGVHTLLATDPIGIVVYGFDRFVSYAYVGGLNLDVIN